MSRDVLANAEPEVLAMAYRQACEELMVMFCNNVDWGRARANVGLFTADGEMNAELRHQLAGAPALSARGSAELGVLFGELEDRTNHATKHISCNHLVRLEGPDTAVGTSTQVVYHLSGRGSAQEALTPHAIHECADTFRRDENGAWRFARRHIRALAQEPGSTA